MATKTKSAMNSKANKNQIAFRVDDAVLDAIERKRDNANLSDVSPSFYLKLITLQSLRSEGFLKDKS